MRRKRAFRRGRAVSILVAAAVGYLIGTWGATAVRNTREPSAAQTVALRFPQDLNDAPAVKAAAGDRPAVAAVVAAATVMGDADFALFEPQPMVARPAVPQAAVQSAPTETADPSPAPPASAAAPPPGLKPGQPAGGAKPHATRRLANRPGYMLDAAQVASIKQRLHLTPDQERMWPAVEVALRNIAFARAHEALRRDAPGAVDPNSAEVQDLKSAAIPLLMSFSDEQKNEVRSLAHVMGLDQLAAQL